MFIFIFSVNCVQMPAFAGICCHLRNPRPETSFTIRCPVSDLFRSSRFFPRTSRFFSTAHCAGSRAAGQCVRRCAGNRSFPYIARYRSCSAPPSYTVGAAGPPANAPRSARFRCVPGAQIVVSSAVMLGIVPVLHMFRKTHVITSAEGA